MNIEVRHENRVGWLVLDRPEVKNAMDLDLLAELAAGFDRLRADGARALVIGGNGGAFCAGADLGLVRQAFAGDPPSVLGPLVDNLHSFIRALQAFPGPVIAACEGPAVGAGLGLALACDLRVAGRGALFVPAYFAIGTSPDGGVSYFLTRALGRARALSIIVRNRAVKAEVFEQWGLVDELVDDGTALERAGALAQELAGTAPLALMRTRELVDTAAPHTLSEHLDAERAGVAAMWPTHDFHEGVTAFLERRRPVFDGT